MYRYRTGNVLVDLKKIPASFFLLQFLSKFQMLSFFNTGSFRGNPYTVFRDFRKQI